jgi:hypothetical protein
MSSLQAKGVAVPMSVSRLFEPRATRQSFWRSSGPGSDVNAAGAMGCIIVSQYGRPRRAEVDSKSIDSKIVENTSFRVVCHFTRVRMACPQFRLMYRYPASGEPPDFREHGIFQMRFRTRWRRAWIRAIYPQRRQCDFSMASNRTRQAVATVDIEVFLPADPSI